MPMTDKIVFVVPKSLQEELRLQVIKDRYGLRGKSKWIMEAIETLLKQEKFEDLVNYGDEFKTLEKKETLVLTSELRKRIEQAISHVKKCYPSLEGIQSRIVRTAILHRLIRS